MLQDLVLLEGIEIPSYVEWSEDTSFVLWLSWEWLEEMTTDRVLRLDDMFQHPGHPDIVDMLPASDTGVECIDMDNPSDSHGHDDHPDHISVHDISVGQRSLPRLLPADYDPAGRGLPGGGTRRFARRKMPRASLQLPHHHCRPPRPQLVQAWSLFFLGGKR